MTLPARHVLLRGGVALCALALSATSAGAEPEGRPRSRYFWGPTYEARAELSGIFLANEVFAQKGYCATGNGVAHAAIYGHTDQGGGSGAGAGVGGRVGWMLFAPAKAEDSPAFWALRAAVGLDLHVLRARTAVGIIPAQGELCAQVEREPAQVSYADGSLFLGRIPFELGAMTTFSIGPGRSFLHGVTFGAAWSPSILLAAPWLREGSARFAYLGAEATMDFSNTKPSRARDPSRRLRVAATIVLPASEKDPTLMTLSVGAVWY